MTRSGPRSDPADAASAAGGAEGPGVRLAPVAATDGVPSVCTGDTAPDAVGAGLAGAPMADVAGATVDDAALDGRGLALRRGVAVGLAVGVPAGDAVPSGVGVGATVGGTLVGAGVGRGVATGVGVGGPTTVTVGPLMGSGSFPWLTARNSTGHDPAGSVLAPM